MIKRNFFRASYALVAISGLTLAACETTAPGPTEQQQLEALLSCDGDTACAVASLMADAVNRDSGKQLSEHFRLRGGTSEGRTVINAVESTTALGPLLASTKGANGTALGTMTREIFCSSINEGDLDEFLALGGKLRIITYQGSSNTVLDDQTFDSRC